jgi:REP element-mobilizing transposase RayT
VARKRRDQTEGLRHIWCRGNRKQPVFSDDYDREAYLALLAKVARELGWRVVAYCLMTNHVHLMVYVPADTMAKGVQILHGEYAQYINRRWDYVGHLWEKRYSATRVDDEGYSLQLDRYVVNNPRRAGMVESAIDWKWSSYRATVGKAPAPPYLETKWSLKHFSANLDVARQAYAEFVNAGLEVDAPRAPADQAGGQAPVRGRTGRVPDD